MDYCMHPVTHRSDSENESNRRHTIVLDNFVQGREFRMLGHQALDPVIKDVPPKQERSDGAQDISDQDNRQRKGHRLEQKPSSDGEERSWEEQPTCDRVEDDEQDCADAAVVIDVAFFVNRAEKEKKKMTSDHGSLTKQNIQIIQPSHIYILAKVSSIPQRILCQVYHPDAPKNVFDMILNSEDREGQNNKRYQRRQKRPLDVCLSRPGTRMKPIAHTPLAPPLHLRCLTSSTTSSSSSSSSGSHASKIRFLKSM